MHKMYLGLLLLGLVGVTLGLSRAEACGGLFCQNVPVDQQAERIIFTMNDNSTISAYVQINYTGAAPDFSWVVPVPSVPELDVAEMDTFDELSRLTAPVFVWPSIPSCAAVVMFEAVPESENDDGVTILAQGQAGPYDYTVITSDDPDALIIWLRENQYRVTEEMEPLIHVYNAEGMVFLAMKLSPEKDVQDIQPIKMTYESSLPMIPLRLTAVAANPNMTVLTWIFADAQAYPTNYAHPTINLEENYRVQFGFGDNYLQLVDMTVDLYEGRAFITEFAGPTADLASSVSDPLLKELVSNYAYLTRFMGRISPEEMTVDPVFDFDDSLPDFSNVHDLSKADPNRIFSCEDAPPVKVDFDPNVVPEAWQ